MRDYKEYSVPELHLKAVIADITQLDCECIVNAANKTLLGGGGVDGAIHRAAGPQLVEECRTLNGCRTGEAKITKGYRLKADYVIHTVGPVYGTPDAEKKLKDCYRNSLELARTHEIHSLAFPMISTGVYGYPRSEAAPAAFSAVRQWQQEHRECPMEILFCCFDEESFELLAGYMQQMKTEL